MNDTKRLRTLRRRMAAAGLESLLVSHLPDVRYLCGFTGSNAALAISPGRAALFTDGRYTVQAKQETFGARVVIAEHSALREACAFLAASGVAHAAFDPSNTTVAALETMRSAIPARQRRSFFQPSPSPLVADLRMVKDSGELQRMEEAAALGCRLFEELLPKIARGTPETVIAAELEYAARRSGAEGMSFDTIVASGPRSALPHGHATSAKLPRNGFMVLDFGVILKGYCSDMTRTVFVGKAGNRERFAYDSVLEAQQAAVQAVRPGVTCGEVDEAARSVLRKAGLAQYFTHSTGHGVGMEVHEAPRVAAAQTQVLKPGMVITIEPGIYIAGEFGIRIEDMVVVTDRAGRVITPATKALIEL
ncbi:MAG TPA: aminopeptidase P family protein [Acidisarcina sp.]|nr:aminopeptidase P family protein [Acidisarcina sp.]